MKKNAEFSIEANPATVELEDLRRLRRLGVNRLSIGMQSAVPGGFYWAGSTVVGDAVIVGTDDGASGFTGDSHLFALNKKNGDVISDITLAGMGDQRSSIAYSAEKGRAYFTTKNGYIASVTVNATTGALSDLKSSKVASQATSTPVVYGDIVLFSAGSGVVPNSNGGTLCECA